MSKRRYNNLKTFRHLAKRAYKQSKKDGLGWSWNDAQRWTSANLYQDFKGQPVSKIRVTTIDKRFNEILEGPVIRQFERFPEYCYNPFLIPTADLEDTNWWMIPDEVDKFDPNLQIALEFDGFINSGIVKKSTLPPLIPIREEMRKAFSGMGSDSVMVIFKILVAPNRKDDGEACSYYVLCTFEGSAADLSNQNEIVRFVREQDLPEEIQTERAQERERTTTEKSSQKTKKSARERTRPTRVKDKPEKEPPAGEKYTALNQALERLRKDFDDGILSKAQYLSRQQKLLDKFDMGGTV